MNCDKNLVLLDNERREDGLDGVAMTADKKEQYDKWISHYFGDGQIKDLSIYFGASLVLGLLWLWNSHYFGDGSVDYWLI